MFGEREGKGKGENCPICTNPLYSIITRRFGEIAICTECHDAFQPILNAISKEITDKATIARSKTTSSRTTIAKMLLDEFDLKREYIEVAKFEIDIS